MLTLTSASVLVVSSAPLGQLACDKSTYLSKRVLTSSD